MTPASLWTAQNQRCTALLVRRVARLLADGPDADVTAIDAELSDVTGEMARPSAMATLRAAFGLSGFESDVVMMCTALELDSDVRHALTQSSDGAQGGAVTFGLALAVLPDPHWSALTPQAPLRRWELVELGAGPGQQLTTRPVVLAERVLHAQVGVRYLDEATGLRTPTAGPDLTAGQTEVAEQAAAALVGAASGGVPPVVQLLGRSGDTASAVAAAAARGLGLTAAVLDATDVPGDGAERAMLARRLEREAALAGVLVVIAAHGIDAAGAPGRTAGRLVDELSGPLVVLARSPLATVRGDMRLAIPDATAQERLRTWSEVLGRAGAALDGHVARAAELFDLDPSAIRATAAEFAVQPERDSSRFWQLVRERARPRLDHLTNRVQPGASWDLLVLPDTQLTLVRDLAAQVRVRAKVHGDWGFDAGGGRGAGISALFTGPSGTGKTMTAEVIAAELGLDLYRIDLSRVVSKYIGETEKNLGSVFDEAEGAGAILLFDEADALFGRRSEVRDSHDRYANLEVSYLLQRMESYDGLAILTTNQREALDPAFLRRLRFVVPFPFPDESARARIWRRIFPASVPADGLDFDRLGQLNVAGGNIRTMALNATFYAAAEGTSVKMAHCLRAARAEFAKLDRPLPEAQVRGWT
ncbi:ATP-binding protein [Streptomyces sp. NPDC059900]|uniref:ATP-binding protein n=1 Tax=Streptomyces sp. NPDC059900 TaxID=3155816 RepID=UPI003426700A